MAARPPNKYGTGECHGVASEAASILVEESPLAAMALSLEHVSLMFVFRDF